jgi:hypothetical protein
MSPISAKVVLVYKETRQYRVVVRIDFDKYPGPFHEARFFEGFNQATPKPLSKGASDVGEFYK